MNNNAIVIKDLKKYFGKLHAVDGISLTVKSGEIFGFLGPNGAGKSTTIRCLMGFNAPSSGNITVLGFDMATDSVQAKKQIGYLSGNMKLYDKWTGWDHIKFYESVRGKSRNLNDLIKRLDFNPKAKFRHLSSGNKQKLGLILALMHEPKLIVMDEPTVGLDPLLQFEIHKILKEMRDNGATIFISSHNLPEIESLCDRVAIIKQGKLVAVETVKNLSDKKIHKIDIKFAGVFDDTELKIPNVDSVEKTGNGYLISVNGDLNPILHILAKHKITDLEITHATLEDVFMKFYERTK